MLLRLVGGRDLLEVGEIVLVHRQDQAEAFEIR